MDYKTYCFCLKKVPLRVVKGQALADFLVEHSYVDIRDSMDNCQGYVQLEPWGLPFDESKHPKGARAGVMVTSPNGVQSKYMCSLDL